MTTLPRGSSEAIAKAPGLRWTIMGIWMISHVWGYVILESLGLLLPSMREDLSLTPIQEGLLGSAPRIGTMLLAIPASWLLSRVRPKVLTSVTLAIGVGLVLLQAWAPFFIILLLGRFLFGISMTAREPARALLMKQWIAPKEYVVVNAFANLVWGLVAMGFIITPIILVIFDDSWRKTLLVFGAVLLLMTVVWLLLGRERRTPEYEDQVRSQLTSPAARILKYRELWVMGLGMMGIGITYSAFATFWPSLMLDAFGQSLQKSSIILAISGLISAVGGIAVGVLVSRGGKKRAILVLTGMMLAGSNIGLLWTDAMGILVLLALLNGLSWTFFPITMTIPFELEGIKPREIAVAIAFMQTAVWVGAFIGPLLAGALQEASGDIRPALVVTSLAALLMTLGAILLPRGWDRPSTPQPALSQ